MDKINNIKVIQHFYNKPMNTTRGIYDCVICGKQEVLVRKDNDVYGIQHLLEKPELMRVREDVRDELFSKLKQIL
ncbi:hypothetical protein ACR77J_07430 [Tissierella praeacuta]|uniref:hypothetical protein n=1 Tax=Tissierella praeacuta TaxID=43131 RepID=UPI003DA1F578